MRSFLPRLHAQLRPDDHGAAVLSDGHELRWGGNTVIDLDRRHLFRSHEGIEIAGFHRLPLRTVDPEGDAEGSLTLSMLEQCFVPHPANTVALEDNAKLSLVVEDAIQLLWACDLMVYSEEFEEAVEKGIKAREAKAKKRRTGKVKGDEADALAQEILTNSGERIRLLLEVLKASQEAES